MQGGILTGLICDAVVSLRTFKPVSSDLILLNYRVIKGKLLFCKGSDSFLILATSRNI